MKILLRSILIIVVGIISSFAPIAAKQVKQTWKKDPKILRVGIFQYSQTGGHYTAAKAIKENLEERLGKKCTVEIIHYDGAHVPAYGEDKSRDKKMAGKEGVKKYLEVYRKVITALNLFFSLEDGNKFENLYDYYKYCATKFGGLSEAVAEVALAIPGEIVSYSRNGRVLKEYNIASSEPPKSLDYTKFDLLIFNHPFISSYIAYEVPHLKQDKIPIMLIHPDADEAFWGFAINHPNVLYILPSDTLVRRANKMNCPHFRRISSIPIRKGFRDIRKTSKRDMKEKLGFDPDKPLVLVMFGSSANDRMYEIAFALQNVNAVFITSQNKPIQDGLKFLNNPNHRILGYTDDKELAEYMRAADVMAGRPGGPTTFEALQCETPIAVLLEDIHPNEKGCLEVLLSYNCCKLLNTWNELPYEVEGIIADDKYRQGPFIYNADDEIAATVEDIADNYDEWRERLWEPSTKEVASKIEA